MATLETKMIAVPIGSGYWVKWGKPEWIWVLDIQCKLSWKDMLEGIKYYGGVMSSDNGIIIKELPDNTYKVYEYCASLVYEKVKDMRLLGTYDNLSDALERGTNEYTEYGVSLSRPPQLPDPPKTEPYA